MADNFEFRNDLRALREAVVERRRFLVQEFVSLRQAMEKDGTLLLDSGAKFAETLPAIQAQLVAIDAAIEDEAKLEDEG